MRPDHEQMSAWTVSDHMDEAERLLNGPDESIDDWDTARADNLATALVHATLALAVATNQGNLRRLKARALDGLDVEIGGTG